MTSYPYLVASDRAEEAIDALEALEREFAETFGEGECPPDLADLWFVCRVAREDIGRHLEGLAARIEEEQTRWEDERDSEA